MRRDLFGLHDSVERIQSLKLVAEKDIQYQNKILGYSAFYGTEGEFMIVLQHGVLDNQTRLGR